MNTKPANMWARQRRRLGFSNSVAGQPNTGTGSNNFLLARSVDAGQMFSYVAPIAMTESALGPSGDDGTFLRGHLQASGVHP